MKKIIAIIFSLFIITSMLTFSEYTRADSNFTEVEFRPNVVTTTNLSQITIGLYVIPENGEVIDTVATDLVTFSADKLQFVGSGVTWGNLFKNGMVKLDGDVDNNLGIVEDIIWGSFSDEDDPGYMYYMTFNVVGSGIAYVNLSYQELGIAWDGYDMPKRINSNCTVYISEIPLPPSINANVVNSTQINLNWTKGEGGDITRVEYSTNPTPWGLGGGTLLHNGTEGEYEHKNLNPHTTYYYQFWSWNETFSRWSEQNVSIERTTLNNIPQMSSPYPQSDYASVYTKNMSVYVFDEDDDTMDVEFHWENGSLIYIYENATSDTTVNISLSDQIPRGWLRHDLDYNWYVSITDGVETYTSDIWLLRTSKPWDINEDRTVNYLDVSSLAANYLNTLIPGSKGWDINNDGKVNYLDISSLVAHYLESY